MHRFYQEFLGKSLTEKYTSLSSQMDKVIHNANSEISTLHKKISGARDSELNNTLLTLQLSRLAPSARATPEEKPGADRPLPRQSQEALTNDQPIQPPQSPRNAKSDADRRVRHSLPNFEHTFLLERHYRANGATWPAA